jgi:hypothetical protein
LFIFIHPTERAGDDAMMGCCCLGRGENLRLDQCLSAAGWGFF